MSPILKQLPKFLYLLTTKDDVAFPCGAEFKSGSMLRQPDISQVAVHYKQRGLIDVIIFWPTKSLYDANPDLEIQLRGCVSDASGKIDAEYLPKRNATQLLHRHNFFWDIIAHSGGGFRRLLKAQQPVIAPEAFYQLALNVSTRQLLERVHKGRHHQHHPTRRHFRHRHPAGLLRRCVSTISHANRNVRIHFR